MGGETWKPITVYKENILAQVLWKPSRAWLIHDLDGILMNFAALGMKKKTLFWIEILHSPGNDQHILFPAGTLESNFFVPCPFRWDRDMWSFLEGTINLVGQHYLKKERRPSKKSTKIHPFTRSNIQESPAWEAILWFGNLSACPPHYHHQCDSQHIHPILHVVPSNRKTVNGVTAESHQKRS